MKIALEEYISFRNSESWDEKYKWEIFSDLNERFQDGGFTSENIQDKISLLRKKNPFKGSFVNWMPLSKLVKNSEIMPNIIANFMNILFNESKDIKIRIDESREYLKKNSGQSISLPGLSYLLCAYDYRKYPLYKKKIFVDLFRRNNKKFPYGHDLATTYYDYRIICEEISKILSEYFEDTTPLDGQDFIYVISQYEIVVNNIIKRVFELGYYEYYKKNDIEKKREIVESKISILKKDKISDDEIIDFFKDFWESSGYVASNVVIKKKSVFDGIKDNVSLLRELIEDVKEHNIDVHKWFEKIKTISNFGKAALTIFFHVFYPNEYAILNDKIKGGHNLLLIDYGKEKKDSEPAKYIKICKKHKELIDLLPEGGDLYTIDQMMHFVVKELPKLGLKSVVRLTPTTLNLSEEKKHLAFKFLKFTFSELGITDPDDSLISLTLIDNNTGIRLNYGNVSLVSFWENKFMLALEGTLDIPGLNMHTEKFDSLNFDLYLYTLTYAENWPLNQKISGNYKNTMRKLKEHFASWSKSNYKRFHKKELAERILNLKQVYETQFIKRSKYSDYKSDYDIDFNRELKIENLYFENKGDLIDQIKIALKNGNHIILSGPPGTGKSKLAKEICNSYNELYKMTTATSDWSTYDTIGGYMPDEKDGNKLVFKNGHFLDCFQDENGLPTNKWLIIDEINRADIDKAFGSVFSALTGDKVQINSKKDSKYVEIIGRPENDDEVLPSRFFIHPDWRIIATMNTFDKASLYEMSFAFMRRFAFINVGVPKDLDRAFNALVEIWNIDTEDFSEKVRDKVEKVKEIWRKINDYRKIGPAIVEDILNYVKNDGKLSDAIAMYILPQLEGLTDDKKINIVNDLKKIIPEGEVESLTEIACDFFDMDKRKFNVKD